MYEDILDQLEVRPANSSNLNQNLNLRKHHDALYAMYEDILDQLEVRLPVS